MTREHVTCDWTLLSIRSPGSEGVWAERAGSSDRETLRQWDRAMGRGSRWAWIMVAVLIGYGRTRCGMSRCIPVVVRWKARNENATLRLNW